MLKPLPKSALARQENYAAMSNAVCSELVFAANNADDYDAIEIRALAARIALCNHKSNAWLVKGAYERQNGHRSDATGRFWHCNSKLCQWCLARQSRATRQKLREVLLAQQLQSGERYYFATLTIPNIGLPQHLAREIVQRAWELLRKRDVCVALIRGGFKSEEFTVTTKGTHYHTHHIWLSKFMSFDYMRAEWTDCAKKAFAESGLQLHVNTADGLLLCKFLMVSDPNQVVNEVCKYVTKCDSWTKVPSKDLASIAMVRRWQRMTEFYGSFAPDRGNPALFTRPILDTERVSDGETTTPQVSWRDLVHQMDLDVYLLALEEKLDRARDYGLRRLKANYPECPVMVLECA